MKLDILPVGALGANCCIVSDEAGDAAVLDPGGDAPAILARLAEDGLRCKAILLTHGHPDHTGALAAVKAATGAEVCVGAGDAARLPVPADRRLSDGDRIPVGALEFMVIATPGHTEGGVCYLCGDTLFAGDTLFFESVGRTDLPGGDYAQLRASLAKLRALPYADLRVIPGHGALTTLAHERKANWFMP